MCGGGEGCCNEVCSCVCAYFLPPLGVFWRFGCGMQFFICLILTLCGYLPGILYAACIIGCENPASGREVSDLCGEATKVNPEDYVTLPQ
mmetsp:Transcript_3851/g.8862  ORF Transcript_3851/g.8862 Transcript_3851/m.8862 type:complete len:90 (+) Transcript_3851:77-346(+)